MKQQSITTIAPLAILLLLLSIPTTITAWQKRLDPHGKTIIAYYASWQWYDRNGLAKPSNLDHTKVTRYNFAFFQINSSGDIWGTDEWADAITLYGEYDWMYVAGQDEAYCSWDHEGEPPSCAGHYYETGLIYQAHEAGTEVYPSIGGWTLSDPFPALAANAEARKKFADNCVKLIETYDFDGIDIDWEYPGYAAHSGTPEDTENYSLFLKDIREALDGLGARTGRFYGLTAALPCGPALIDNIQIDVVSNYLTELNLMTYDFHGSWNSETGANAPLFDMEGSPEFSVDGCVKNWMEGGGRPEQINIGLPFYGRSFQGSGLTSFGDTHNGYADSVTWADDEGSPQYFNIVDKLSQFTTIRDPVTKTQYMYNSQGFVSYDDERAICDKTEYAMDNNLNGYIIWEISGDLLPDMSTPLLDATNDRLNTDERCEPDPVLDVMEVVDAGAVDTGTDVIVGQPWYPHQALGYCVSDGNQLENFIRPDQMFGSALACCEAIFSHNPDCTASSLDPGSDGQWVSLGDDQGTEEPWYPHQKLNICVNDGKHEKRFIADDQLFSSAQACCDALYSYNADCLSVSTGIVMDDSMSIWYPESNGCTSESPVPSWIITTYSSKEDCCLKYFGEHHDTCLTGVTAQAMETAITPQPTPQPTNNSKPNPNNMDAYVQDSAAPEPTPHPTKYQKPNPNNMDAYIQDTVPEPTETTTNNMDAYIQDTVPEPTVAVDESMFIWYPKDNDCTSKSPIPSWIFTTYSSKEECCLEYFGKHHDTCKAGDLAHAMDTEIVGALNEYLFHPHFGDGMSVACRTGDVPGWMPSNMVETTKQECCESFSSPWSDQCLNHPYYPDFQDHSCHNDGNQPNWMSGDYLSSELWLCCHNFFSGSDEIAECAGLENCDDCDVSGYLSNHYEVLNSQGRPH